MLELTLALGSSCLPGQLRYIIHFLHAFDSDAVDLPLRPIANRLVGVFVWALAPFFVLGLFSAVCFAVSAGETQVWLGDLRVVVCGVFLVSVLLSHRFAYSKDFVSLYRVLSAYSHVRTEPLVRHRPHSRKKNNPRTSS